MKDEIQETPVENNETHDTQKSHENEGDSYGGQEDDGIHGTSQDAKERKKRRSKNDGEARNYKCKHCEKTYLSDIALNQHVKTKHAHLVEIVSRGRGRPRKSNGMDGGAPIPSYDQKFKDFFKMSIRSNVDTEKFDWIETAKANFKVIYEKYKEKDLFKEIKDIDTDNYPLIDASEGKSCDYAFWKYLEFCGEKTNKDYFEFTFKFIVLFRECINKNKGEEYTKINTAEIVPDMCNEFVSDFMESNNFYGLEVGELIEVIQHCCHWLWENHHTTSRLTLVNN